MITFTSYVSSLTDPVCRLFLATLSRRLETECRYLDGDWPSRLDLIERGLPDVAWICGLLHVMEERTRLWHYEPVAAPVMRGRRYGGQPVYFADLIVHASSNLYTLGDALGRRWAVNETSSFSGYHMLCCRLAQRGMVPRVIGQIVETGSHLQSLNAVLQQTADFATIDSTVWDAFVTQRPEQAGQLRVIATLGPFPAPPVVVSTTAPAALGHTVRNVLLELHTTSGATRTLNALHIDRFAPVTNASYEPIRALVLT